MTDDTGTWTIRRLLEWTGPFFARKGVESSRLAAELLLSHVLGVARIKLYTDYDKTLSESQLAAFRELVRRAGEHEPVAYLTGKAHFYNLEFEVTRDVLIPRPDTETIVQAVVQIVRHDPEMQSPRVLDLCTGSGCVAIAIARQIKSAIVTATDISLPAVEVARCNAQRLGVAERVLVAEGDLFDALSNVVDKQPYHLIVGNPPYIASGDIPKLDRNVKDYEPIQALDGGPDGLATHRRILTEAAAHLMDGGHILLEIAFDQGELAKQVAADHKWLTDVRILKDDAGHDRVLAGRKSHK